jgi:TRAP-type C4-dicarboxylate transport system substrate-binding protein
MRQSLRVASRVGRALPAASAAALVALIVGCGGSGEKRAGSAHYQDAAGDAGTAPDLRAVDVTSNEKGRITFDVTLDPASSGAPSGVDLWLDTDADPETGNTTFDDAGGAEYLLSSFLSPEQQSPPMCGFIGRGKGCLSRWTDDGWTAATAPTARLARKGPHVTISIDRSDLADSEELNFYAIGRSEEADPDRAPGRGTFNYSLARGGPRAEATPARDKGPDKAGGRSDGGPVVLTLASHDYDAFEASEFASAVDRLSGGGVRIDVKSGVRFYEVDYERGTIADVRNADYDLAIVGARAWDGAGVKSFNALVAPFLVDSYELQRRVLESSLAERMLEGVAPLGLVGIGVVPGELRRPLGLTRKLVRPADYRGARVGIRPARVADAAMDALGARGEGFQAHETGLVGFDGAESGVGTIRNNGYDTDARALTANVVLWSRPTTIFMNDDAFNALTDDQQDALRQAGLEAIEPVLTTIEENEQASLDVICTRSRLSLVTASPADRAALRRAVRPVYDELRRDSLTADLIDEIESMRREQGSATEPLRCPGARGAAGATMLDGLWRSDVSRGDLRAVGAQLEQLERSEGTWTIELDEGRWVARNHRSGAVYRGTYTVEGDHLSQTTDTCVPSNLCVRGQTDEYTWSRYGDKLELARIPGRPYNLAATAKAFARVR